MASKVRNIDELIVLLKLSEVREPRKVARMIVKKARSVIKHLSSLRVPRLSNTGITSTFEIVPTDRYNLVFCMNYLPSSPQAGKIVFPLFVTKDSQKFLKKGTLFENSSVRKVFPSESMLAKMLFVNTENGVGLDRLFYKKMMNCSENIPISSPLKLYAFLLAAGVKVSFKKCEKMWRDGLKLAILSRDLRLKYPNLSLWYIMNIFKSRKIKYGIIIKAGVITGNMYIHVVPSFSKEYNLIRAGNYIALLSQASSIKTVYLSPDVFDSNYSILLPKVLRNELNRLLITKEEFEEMCVRNFHKDVLEIKKIAADTKKHDIILERLKKGNFSIGDIIFKRTRIKYQNQKIGVGNVNVSKVIPVSAIFENSDNNFMLLYNTFIDNLFTRGSFVSHFIGKKIYLGNFYVIISHDKNMKRRYLVNNISIRKEDLKEVLRSAIQFNSVEDYTNFLKNVCVVPLEVMSLLKDGLHLTVSDNEWYEEFSFTVLKDGNKYFLAAGKVKVPINLKEISSLRRKNFRSEIDLYNELAKICSGKEAIRLIKASRVNQIDTNERGRQLLHNVLKRHHKKVKPIKVRDNGSFIEGIYVKGKIREYFINMDAQVFEYKRKKLVKKICIIDKRWGATLNKYDRIVTRIYWLLNDKYVVDKVETLKY